MDKIEKLKEIYCEIDRLLCVSKDIIDLTVKKQLEYERGSEIPQTGDDLSGFTGTHFEDKPEKQPEGLEKKMRNAKPHSLIPVTEEELKELNKLYESVETDSTNRVRIMEATKFDKLVDFISQLLSERTFTERELRIIGEIIEKRNKPLRGLANRSTLQASEDIIKKIIKLLKEED